MLLRICDNPVKINATEVNMAILTFNNGIYLLTSKLSILKSAPVIYSDSVKAEMTIIKSEIKVSSFFTL